MKDSVFLDGLTSWSTTASPELTPPTSREPSISRIGPSQRVNSIGMSINRLIDSTSHLWKGVVFMWMLVSVSLIALVVLTDGFVTRYDIYIQATGFAQRQDPRNAQAMPFTRAEILKIRHKKAGRPGHPSTEVTFDSGNMLALTGRHGVSKIAPAARRTTVVPQPLIHDLTDLQPSQGMTVQDERPHGSAFTTTPAVPSSSKALLSTAPEIQLRVHGKIAVTCPRFQAASAKWNLSLI